MSSLARIESMRLFEVGGEAITPMHLLVLALVLLATLYVARLTRALLERRLLRAAESGARYTFVRLAQYTVWWLGAMLGLRVLNIDPTGIALAAGVLGVGAGLGLQGIVANFVAGLVLLFERPIKIRDRVTVENIEGSVVAISFRSTTIVTNDNIAVIVPNSDFINRSVINWSHSDRNVRIHAPVGVAYGSDVALVSRVLLAVAAETPGALASPAPEVRFTEFGESSLNFELLVWTDEPEQHHALRSRLNFAIDAGFRKAGVQIPFPQRDLHLRSSAVPLAPA
jgi:small-conductance mechanosensitive channel